MTGTTGTGDGRRAIVDAHVHLFDHTANLHRFLEARDAMYEALVGDYATLPRTYLLDDYLRDTASRRVEGIVWHEFLSEDPVREARWGQALADASPIPHALVARVDPGGTLVRLHLLPGVVAPPTSKSQTTCLTISARPSRLLPNRRFG